VASHTVSTKRRIVFAVAAVIVVVAVFVVRLVDIQLVRADALVSDSLTKTTANGTIYAPRGEILDTNGNILASTVALFDITTSPRDVKEFDRTIDGKKQEVTVEQALTEVGAITGQSASDLRKIIDDALAANSASNYALLIKSQSADNYQKIRDLNIPWIYTEQNPGRTYPNGSVAGNVIGFVGSDQKGLAGVELQQNACLTGENGTQSYQRSKDGVALPGTTEVTTAAKEGGNVKLTIDADLNWYMQQLVASQIAATGATSGTVMVTEVKTGKIRALAEWPSVDPNDINATAPEDRGSKAFTAPFEPGSIFKPLTAASLIDAGLATPTSQVLAEYRYKPENGASIKDALPHDPERLTLTGVLQQSSNTGLSKLGEKMSAQDRYNYLKKFGIGDASAIGFPGEDSGILHPWEKWDNQTDYVTMFGQGVAVTAIQMANAYQAIANGGVELPMQLVEGCEYSDGTTTEVPAASQGKRVISEEASKEVLGMMETVVTNGFLAKDLTMPGYRVAAKSGTAEQSDGAGKLKKTYVASMAGTVPAEDPQYVITVHLKDPLTLMSSAAAAPVFKQAVTQVIKRYGIPPSTGTPANYPGEY